MNALSSSEDFSGKIFATVLKAEGRYAMINNETKVRTTSEISVMLAGVGSILVLSSAITFAFVRNIFGFLVAALVPIVYSAIVFWIIKHRKNALVVNHIGEMGIKNSYLGEVMCEMIWSEIGDFGVAEVKGGLLKGKYIYVSRVFVNNAIRRDIIRRYDPRVCIVMPCTEEVCKVLNTASGGKIDI